MRAFIIFVAMALGLSASCQAAGFQSVSFTDQSGAEIRLGIWYPSDTPVRTQDLGAFTFEVAKGGAVRGTDLPLIIISHGTGGSRLTHYDTAIALADAGYVVAAPSHPGDNYKDQSRATDIMARAGHVSAVIDYMLQAWSQRSTLAPSRIGMFGHSSGGFTTLVSIGGNPNLALVAEHCKTHVSDYACALVSKQPPDVNVPRRVARASLHDARIGAAVIAAPALGFTFDRAALRDVRIPIQLWRAEDDILLPHPWYDEAVRTALPALPALPDYHVVATAGHFDFLAPCSEQLASIAPPICTSKKGFDRVAFHRRFNGQVAAFFNRTLRK